MNTNLNSKRQCWIYIPFFLCNVIFISSFDVFDLNNNFLFCSPRFFVIRPWVHDFCGGFHSVPCLHCCPWWRDWCQLWKKITNVWHTYMLWNLAIKYIKNKMKSKYIILIITTILASLKFHNLYSMDVLNWEKLEMIFL